MLKKLDLFLNNFELILFPNTILRLPSTLNQGSTDQNRTVRGHAKLRNLGPDQDRVNYRNTGPTRAWNVTNRTNPERDLTVHGTLPLL